MKKVDREIALLLCRAQNASDGGKASQNALARICQKNDLPARDFLAGYDIKDELIVKAMVLIMTNPSSFSFYVERNLEGGRFAITRAIVYFNFKINGRRRQISFHSLNGAEYWGCGENWGNRTHRTRWQTKNGGSGRAAIDLVKAYKLNYTVY